MGNDFKLKEGRFGLDIRKKFFTPAILALPETVVFFFFKMLPSSRGGSEYRQKIQQHVLKCVRLVTLDRVDSSAQVLENNPPQKDNS